MNAPAAAIPDAKRTVVRWLGVIGLHRSGLTRARARRASHEGVAALALGSSDGSGMAEEVNAAGPMANCRHLTRVLATPPRPRTPWPELASDSPARAPLSRSRRTCACAPYVRVPPYASRAAGQAPHGLGRVRDRQQRGVGQADARRAAPGAVQLIVTVPPVTVAID